MKNFLFTKLAIGVTLSLMTVASANAAVYRWSFSNLDQSDFAFLDFDTDTSNFRLFDNPSNNYLAPAFGVNGIALDFVGPQTLPGLLTTIPTFTDTYSNVSIGNLVVNNLVPVLPSGFVRGYSSISNGTAFEINNGESTTFNITTIDFSNIDNVAVRLNSGTGLQPTNGTWVVGSLVQTTPVPEAETTAMMALGLGLIGFMTKRRRKV